MHPLEAERFAGNLAPLLASLIFIGVVQTATAQQSIAIFNITNSWRYNQSGADLSGQFNQTDFDDSTWPSGRGLLGLESSSPFPYAYPILTPLTVGGGRITYYFRTHFNFTNNPAGVTLTATNCVDDGAVYYLNGVEVGRLRMPVGDVTAATLAGLANPEGQKNVFPLSSAPLLQGDNVLAVEVHQNAANSSDVVFGMGLTATLPPPGPARITTQPNSVTVEEGDTANFAVDLTGSPPFYFQWLKGGLPIDDATNQLYTIIGVTLADAGDYSVIVSNSFGPTNSSVATLTVTPAPHFLFTFTNVWKYNQSGLNLGSIWRTPGYDDSTWGSGTALFYNETTTLPAPKNTLLPLTSGGGAPIITYYFRTRFTWAEATNGANLMARLLVDDGAVIYLNGVEAARIGMPSGTVGYQTLAARTVGDANAYETIRLSTAGLIQGENVLAVEVHQSATDSSDVVFGLALGTNLVLSLPDLRIWGDTTNPRVTTRTFAANACEILEGCAVAGTRRLLQFGTETRNYGTADLFLGNPVNNPLFEYDGCHGHYHYHDFAEYRLLDTNGMLVATGGKVGFCLLDFDRWDPSANASSVYGCDYQGIQKGWSDIYNDSLPCQWIDITGLPPGRYLLEMEIDPENRIEELDEANNVTTIFVDVGEPCSGPPPNDNFNAAQVIPYRIASAVGTNECATSENNEPTHGGINGDKSIWYRWTAPASGNVVITTEGSNFDTVLALYRGSSVGALTAIASDDDGGSGTTSRISTNVTGGIAYSIAIDGFDGAEGRVVLNVNQNGNDAFTACLAIPANTGRLTGNNSDATKQTSEPNHAGNAGGRSVWYCWTATNSGWMRFDTAGSSVDTLLAVYTGSSVGALTSVASDNNSGPALSSRVLFNAVSGTMYRIAVDGADAAAGIFNLNWRPATSRFTGIAVLPNGSLRFNVLGAAGDTYELQTASEMQNWANGRTLTNVTGSLEFTEPKPLSGDQLFYRLRLIP